MGNFRTVAVFYGLAPQQAAMLMVGAEDKYYIRRRSYHEGSKHSVERCGAARSCIAVGFCTIEQSHACSGCGTSHAATSGHGWGAQARPARPHRAGSSERTTQCR